MPHHRAGQVIGHCVAADAGIAGDDTRCTCAGMTKTRGWGLEQLTFFIAYHFRDIDALLRATGRAGVDIIMEIIEGAIYQGPRGAVFFALSGKKSR